MSKSLIEYAFDYLSNSKEKVSFKDLWTYVSKEAGLSDAEAARKIGQFFTNLSLDGRFTAFDGNMWDLRERHEYKDTHKDNSDFYGADNEGEEDKEEEAENKEYNKCFEEPSDSDDDDESEKSEDDESSEEENF